MADLIIKSTDGLMDSFMGKSLYPVYKVVNDMGAAYEKQLAVLKAVFAEESANGFGMKITDEVGIGDFAPTLEGGEYKQSFVQEGNRSQMDFVEWTNHLEITKTMMEDNITSQIKRRAALFGESFARSKEKFRAQMIGNAMKESFSLKRADGATATFSTKSADGVSMFNVAHPSALKDGADPAFTQSNCFKGGVTKDNFGEVVTRMQNFKDDKGDKVGIIPNTIIIPNIHSTKQKMFEIIGSDKDPNTSNNGFNYLFGNWNVIVSPELAGLLPHDSFIICDNDYNQKVSGAVWGNRLEMTAESDIAEKTRNFLLFGRARYNAMFHNFRAFAICGVDTGTVLG